MEAYAEIAELFWGCLLLRGYTARFLAYAFTRAPDYCDRERLRLLTKFASATDDQARTHALVLDYSVALHRCHLSRALHEHKILLPPHLRTAKLIVAWRLPRKILGIVGTFRHPRLNPPLPLPRTHRRRTPKPVVEVLYDGGSLPSSLLCGGGFFHIYQPSVRYLVPALVEMWTKLCQHLYS
jgi:hypothetical protein